MSWRFRRRMTVFPGVRINFSIRGISTTFGVPGANINIGPDGAFLNTGIPGTGFYNRTRISGGQENRERQPRNDAPGANEPSFFFPEGTGAVRSEDNTTITSEGLRGIKETLLASYKEKSVLASEVRDGGDAFARAEGRLRRIRLIPFHRKIFKKTVAVREREYVEIKSSLEEARRQYKTCKVKIEIELEPNLRPRFDTLINAFESLQGCQKLWDITTSVAVDRVKERSAAGTSIERKPVSLKRAALNFVESDYEALHFENANGADLYLFPAFLIMFQTETDFALVDIKDLNIEYIATRFVETEGVPTDSEVVGSTWRYVNKNGSRDMRFSNNYEMPIVRYGEMRFRSVQGLNEAYQFSNATASERFAAAYMALKNELYGAKRSQTYTEKPRQRVYLTRQEALKNLGLGVNATLTEIQEMYKELMKKYHPDKVAHLGEEFKQIAEQKSKMINEAYDLLCA